LLNLQIRLISARTESPFCTRYISKDADFRTMLHVFSYFFNIFSECSCRSASRKQNCCFPIAFRSGFCSLSALFHGWHQERTLKTLPSFMIFVKPCFHGAYDANIVGELADNGLYSCTAVVGADRQKESHLGGVLCATSGPGWLVGLVLS